MKNLTPLLAHPAARERAGWMAEQVRADRDRRRHKPLWWSEGDDMASGGCGGLSVVAVVVPGAAVTVSWHFLF